MGMGMGISFENPMGMGMGMGMIFENGYGYGYRRTRPEPAARPFLHSSFWIQVIAIEVRLRFIRQFNLSLSLLPFFSYITF